MTPSTQTFAKTLIVPTSNSSSRDRPGRGRARHSDDEVERARQTPASPHVDTLEVPWFVGIPQEALDLVCDLYVTTLCGVMHC